MLTWACEAAQIDVASGLVVAGAAFLATLPEFLIEVHFAFTGQAQYVAANLTGASRLLIGCAIALPAVAGAVAGPPDRAARAARAAPRGARRADARRRPGRCGRCWAGSSTFLDAAVLISLYGIYLRRAAAAGGTRARAAPASRWRWPRSRAAATVAGSRG